MIEANLLSEKDVLNRIGATDFRSIKKEQLIEFVSAIPYMPKEVAIKCIEQFPEFHKNATEMIRQLNVLCENLIADNKDSRDKAIHSYQLILESEIAYLEKKPYISHRKRKEIINQMVEIADKITEIHELNTKHQNTFIHSVVGVVALAIVVGGTVLGVKINGAKRL